MVDFNKNLIKNDLMIKESDKYKAQYFQIGAFSCMAPLGKAILDIKDMSSERFNIYRTSAIYMKEKYAQACLDPWE